MKRYKVELTNEEQNQPQKLISSSEPPAGQKRWIPRMLQDEMIKRTV